MPNAASNCQSCKAGGTGNPPIELADLQQNIAVVCDPTVQHIECESISQLTHASVEKLSRLVLVMHHCLLSPWQITFPWYIEALKPESKFGAPRVNLMLPWKIRSSMFKVLD